MTPGCFVCEKHALGSDVPGGIVYQDDLTYVGHLLPPGLDGVYLGYLMVEPVRHVDGLGGLSAEEAAALGQATTRAARALAQSEGAEHVYSFVIGDTVDHLHVHLVPRYPGTPTEFWGTAVRDWLDAPRISGFS